MSKTIEEAKTILFADYCEANKGRVFTGLRSIRYLHFMAGFDAAINHVLSLPLSQRLTDEEREKMRKLYIDANDKLKICLNAMNYNQISELDNEYKKGINMGLILALKYIFGKALFGEGEG